jgi:hypothetical protein
MKVTTVILLVMLSYVVHGQTALPPWGQERFKKWSDKYTLANYLQPQFFQKDFSGDKKPDLALLVERKIDKKKGILFLFSQRDQSLIVGAGNTLSDGGDNFDWADKWEVFENKVVHETTFKENGDVDDVREVALNKPAIRIIEHEGTGGIIYFEGEEFIWIHQGD